MRSDVVLKEIKNDVGAMGGSLAGGGGGAGSSQAGGFNKVGLGQGAVLVAWLLLVLGAVVLCLVLHGAQELTPSGEPVVSGRPTMVRDKTGEGLVSGRFSYAKSPAFLVRVDGLVKVQFRMEIVGGDGKVLSPPRVIVPSPDRPQEVFWKVMKVKGRGEGAFVRIRPESEDGSVAGEEWRKLSVTEIDPGASRRRWLAGGGYAMLVVVVCGMFWRRAVWAKVLAVGAAYFLFLLPWDHPGNFAFTADSMFYIPTSLSLLERGDLDVDEFGGRDSAARFAGEYRVRQGVGGHFFNHYAVGTSLVSLPVAALGNWLYDTVPDSLERSRSISFVAARFLSAGTVALMFLVLLSLGTGTGWALAGAAVFGLATPHVPVHAGLWSHTATAFLSAMTLWLYCRKEGRSAAWAAVPLCVGFMCRPTMAVPGLILAVGLLVRDRRRFLGFAGLSALLGAGFVTLCLVMWDRILPPYYVGHAGLQKNGPAAFLGVLVSPGRGLLVYCPLMVMSIWGGVLAWRRGVAGMGIYRMCGLVVVGQWFLASRNLQWWGGHSYGPRTMAEAMVFAVPLLIPVLRRLLEESRAGVRRGWAVFAAVAVAWGIFVGARGLASRNVYLWDLKPDVDLHPERVWDWRQMPIFASYPETK